MARRLTLLIVTLSLAAGVLAGMPLHPPKDNMMECCKRAKSKERTPKADGARLCCALNCSTTAPANFTITKSIADQIADLFIKEKAVSINPTSYSREILPRTFQPSYIQHHAFLI